MSTRASNPLSSRIRVALLALMILLPVTSAPSPKASAVVACVWYTRVQYYTDASKTTQCGLRYYMCDGELAESGCVTEYVTLTHCDCIYRPVDPHLAR